MEVKDTWAVYHHRHSLMQQEFIYSKERPSKEDVIATLIAMYERWGTKSKPKDFGLVVILPARSEPLVKASKKHNTHNRFDKDHYEQCEDCRRDNEDFVEDIKLNEMTEGE